MKRLTVSSVWLALSFSLVTNFAAEPSPSKPTTQWTTQRQVGRFRVHADFELKGDEPLFNELASMSNSVREVLQLPSSDQTIHVVLFASSKEYGRYIKNYFPTAPERRALFIQRSRYSGMLFVHWHDDVHTDIRHEVVHGLLNDQQHPLPLWLDEGLAEYFEVAETDRVNRNPHLADVCRGLDAGYIPELSDLESLTAIEQLGDPQYRDSWAWVHFMLHRSRDTRQQFVNQLAAIRANPNAMPLSRTIATQLPNWRTDFTEHFRAISREQ